MELTYEELYRLYVTEKKSTTIVAQELKVARSTVFFALRDFGIPRRSRRDAMLLDRSKMLDPSELRRLYLEEHETTQMIAVRFETTRQIVVSNLKRLGIYQGLRSYIGEKNWATGSKHTPETIEKIRQARKGHRMRHAQFYTELLASRFWTKIEKTSECWNWIGKRDFSGYGRLCYRKKYIGAHRLSWVLHFGPIPVGLCVLHQCDNPSCVNPQHLFLGTAKDNVLDMYKKGRYQRIANRQQVIQRVQTLYWNDRHPQSKIAFMLNLHPATVWRYLQMDFDGRSPQELRSLYSVKPQPPASE